MTKLTRRQFLRKLEHDIVLNKDNEKYNPWLQTFTGKAFTPAKLEDLEVSILDISHALNNICRFGGHCKHFYSVLTHSVLAYDIANLFWPDLTSQEKLTILLHDATEAYIGDMVKPVKLGMSEFNALEDKLWLVISKKYHLLSVMPTFVKLSDLIALMYEKKHLMATTPQAEQWFFEKGVDSDFADIALGFLEENNFDSEHYFKPGIDLSERFAQIIEKELDEYKRELRQDHTTG